MYNPDNFPVIIGYNIKPSTVTKVAFKFGITLCDEAKKEVERICKEAPLSPPELVDLAAIIVACQNEAFDGKKVVNELVSHARSETVIKQKAVTKLVTLSASVYRDDFASDKTVSVPLVSRGFVVYG